MLAGTFLHSASGLSGKLPSPWINVVSLSSIRPERRTHGRESMDFGVVGNAESSVKADGSSDSREGSRAATKTSWNRWRGRA